MVLGRLRFLWLAACGFESVGESVGADLRGGCLVFGQLHWSLPAHPRGDIQFVWAAKTLNVGNASFCIGQLLAMAAVDVEAKHGILPSAKLCPRLTTFRVES